MTHFTPGVTLALILWTPCLGQQVTHKYSSNTPQLIRDVLRDAHVSGSLVFSGGCEFQDRPGPVPYVGGRRELGTARETLQGMLAPNSKIRVSQDPDGTIRITEADVPTDILEVRIHRISFDSSDDPRLSALPVHGPRKALWAILQSSEVKTFMQEHQITDPLDFRLEGINALGSGMPDVHGELSEVTVSQALDYVLKTFPGYWIYKNGSCEDGSRKVHFLFY